MKSFLMLIVSCFVTLQLGAVAESKDVLLVTTVLHDPYVMISGEHKRNSIVNRSEITGDLFEGYVIDLLKLLAEKVDFNYTIRLVKDNAYGSKHQNNGVWNGMIGEVIRGEADLAVADLTITSERERVVDFSYPFLTTGIGLLAKRPPYYNCSTNTSSSTAYNCKLSIYPVNEIKDLGYQNAVEYGAVEHGSTSAFFRNSNDPHFSKIGQNLKPMASVSSAVERVNASNGSYMFLMEGLSIEYLTARSCDFIQLGPTTHRRAYGIAMREDFHMKTSINLGLLKMQESGQLDELKNKWFPKEMECDNRLEAVYAKNALNVVLNSLK